VRQFVANFGNALQMFICILLDIVIRNVCVYVFMHWLEIILLMWIHVKLCLNLTTRDKRYWIVCYDVYIDIQVMTFI